MVTDTRSSFEDGLCRSSASSPKTSIDAIVAINPRSWGRHSAALLRFWAPIERRDSRWRSTAYESFGWRVDTQTREYGWWQWCKLTYWRNQSFDLVWGRKGQSCIHICSRLNAYQTWDNSITCACISEGIFVLLRALLRLSFDCDPDSAMGWIPATIQCEG